MYLHPILYLQFLDGDMKKLCGFVFILCSLAFSSFSMASVAGLPVSWGDSLETVSAQNNNIKVIIKNKWGTKIEGFPQSGTAFAQLESVYPYEYEFSSKNKLTNISVDIQRYEDNSAQTIKNATSDYQNVKVKIAKALGVKGKSTEFSTKGVLYFACIMDEYCGNLGTNYITKDSDILLILSGSSDGSRATLMLMIRPKNT